MRLCGLLLITAFATACASVAGMRSLPLDQGAERRFQTDLPTATLAARNAIAASPLAVREFTPIGDSIWSIIAEPVRNEGASELVRVVCQQISPEEVVVRIITRRRNPLGTVISSDWSDALFAQIALELGQKPPNGGG
jgi:hypothetical protein